MLVTTGLDPVVHVELRLIMDCRIKSGNDETEAPGLRFFLLVTTGLDPVVHVELRLIMDCRIKSGNDDR